jgi:hypothetical protein
MTVAALLGILLLGVSDMAVILRLCGGAVLLAVGGTLEVTGDISGTASATPLMLTILGYGVMAFVFLRRLEAAPAAVARLQALRLVMVQAAAVLVLGLLVPGTLTNFTLGSVHAGFNLALTELFAASWLVAVLVVASFLYRPDWLNPRMRAAREQNLGLACAVIVAFVLALSLAALALVIIGISLGQEGGSLAAVLIALPNLALVGITSGLGVPIHTSGAAAAIGLGGGATSTDVTLSQLASASSWFWLLPLGAGVCLVAAGIITAQMAPDLATARRDCLRLAWAVPLMLLLGAWMAGVSLSGASSSLNGTIELYPTYLLVAVLAAVAGALGGSAGFLLAPHIPAGVTRLLRQITDQLRLPRTSLGTGGPLTPTPPSSGATSGAAMPAGPSGVGVPSATVPAGPIRLGTRGRVILIGCAVLFVLLVAGSAVDQHLANSTFGPQQAVTGYLGDLQNGDASGALGELQGAPGASELLTSSALHAAVSGGQVHNVRVGTVSISGDRAMVAATFDVGSQTGQQEVFELTADHVHQHLGRYPTWRITTPLPQLQIQGGAGLSSVTVNGTPIALSDGSATVAALPGRYVVTGPASGPVTTASQTVMITDSATGGSAELQPELTNAAVSQVRAAVDAKIADCAKATVLNPPGCPFSDIAIGTATQVVWNVPPPGSATQLQLDPSGSITFNGDGNASVTYVADAGFGSIPGPQTDPVPYSYSGTVTFSSGAPDVSLT